MNRPLEAVLPYLKKESPRERKSLFWQYLLNNFMLAAIVCLVMLLLLNTSVMRRYQQEAQATYLQIIRSIRHDFDGQFYTLQETAVKVAQNDKLRLYTLQNGGEYAKLLAQNEMRQLMVDSDLWMDMILYYSDSQFDSYISPTNCGAKSLLSATYGYADLNAQKIEQLLATHEHPLLFCTNAQQQGAILPQIIYFLPLSYLGQNAKGAVLFLLNGPAFTARMRESFPTYASEVLLTDFRHDPIFPALPDEAILSLVRQENIPALSSEWTGEVKSGGNRLMVFSLPSAYGNWQYVFALDKEALRPKMLEMRSISLLIAFIILLIGMLLSAAVSWHSCRPIRRLCAKLTGAETREHLPSACNELKIIEHAYEQARQEKAEAMQRAEDQVLLSLLQKNPGEDAEESLPGQLGLPPDRGWLMALMMIDNLHSFREQDGTDEQNLRIIQLQQQLPQALKPVPIRVTRLLSDDCQIVLMPCAGQEERAAMVERLSGFQQWVSHMLGFTVTIVLGKSFSRLCSSREQFLALRAASQYRIIYGWNAMIDLSLLDRQEKEPGKHSYSEIILLELLLDKGKTDAALEHIRKMLDFSPDEASPSLFYSQYTGILNSLLRKSSESPAAHLQERIASAILYQPETAEQARQLLSELTQELCESITASEEDKLTGQLISFLKNHYTDASLCLESVAQAFGMTHSYISRFFKEQTGCSLMAYLDRYRLEKSKELLLTTDLTVKAIVSAVGYVDVNNFIRKFKKNEGLTPLVYRKMSGLPQQE